MTILATLALTSPTGRGQRPGRADGAPGKHRTRRAAEYRQVGLSVPARWRVMLLSHLAGGLLDDPAHGSAGVSRQKEPGEALAQPALKAFWTPSSFAGEERVSFRIGYGSVRIGRVVGTEAAT
jgi:hypothetical protein